MINNREDIDEFLNDQIVFDIDVYNIKKDDIEQMQENCIESGKDKYLILSQRGVAQLKDINHISKNDTIFAKNILFYKDKILSCETTIYKQQFKIVRRIKENRPDENIRYYIVYLLKERKFTLTSIQNVNIDNKLKFDSPRDAERFFSKNINIAKNERDHILGLR